MYQMPSRAMTTGIFCSSGAFSARIPLPPAPTLFPYTTLFRSPAAGDRGNQLRVDSFCRQTAEGFDGDLDSSRDRKSTRLNSSHVETSYAVFCLNKKMLQIVGQIAQVVVVG